MKPPRTQADCTSILKKNISLLQPKSSDLALKALHETNSVFHSNAIFFIENGNKKSV